MVSERMLNHAKFSLTNHILVYECLANVTATKFFFVFSLLPLHFKSLAPCFLFLALNLTPDLLGRWLPITARLFCAFYSLVRYRNTHYTLLPQSFYGFRFDWFECAVYLCGHDSCTFFHVACCFDCCWVIRFLLHIIGIKQEMPFSPFANFPLKYLQAMHFALPVYISLSRLLCTEQSILFGFFIIAG